MKSQFEIEREVLELNVKLHELNEQVKNQSQMGFVQDGGALLDTRNRLNQRLQTLLWVLKN